MSALLLLGYLADVWILGTYAYLSRTGRDVPFHWANALGAIPLLVAEVAAGLWPVLVLTLSFCVLGALGVLRSRRAKRGLPPFKMTPARRSAVNEAIASCYPKPTVEDWTVYFRNRDEAAQRMAQSLHPEPRQFDALEVCELFDVPPRVVGIEPWTYDASVRAYQPPPPTPGYYMLAVEAPSFVLEFEHAISWLGAEYLKREWLGCTCPVGLGVLHFHRCEHHVRALS